MKKFKFFGMAAIAAMAVSCSSDDVVTQVQEDNAIQFGTYVGNAAQSRGTLLNTSEELQTAGFGVYAFYTGQETWEQYANKTAPNFMDNQQVTYSDGAWTYTPLKYWPNNPNDKVSFFAYAPYNDSNATLTKGSSEINFAVDPEVLDQVDLLYAEQLIDKAKTDIVEKVNFNFKHALSAVGLYVEAMTDNVNGDATGEVDDATTANGTIADETIIAIQSVEISGNFANLGTFDPSTNNWTATPDTRTYTFDANEFNQVVAEDVPDVKTQLNNENAYLMVIPQDVEMTVKVVYTVTTKDEKLDGGESVITNTITSDKFTLALDQNKKYNLCLHLGMTSVKMSASIEDWETGDDIVVNVPINK